MHDRIFIAWTTNMSFDYITIKVLLNIFNFIYLFICFGYMMKKCKTHAEGSKPVCTSDLCLFFVFEIK